MYIKSKIERRNGSSVTLGSLTYHFDRQPWSNGEHVAFVQNEKHQGDLLVQDNFAVATVQGPSGDGAGPTDETTPLAIVCAMIEKDDLLAGVLAHFAVNALFEGQDDPSGLTDDQRASIAIATLTGLELTEENRMEAIAALGVDIVGDAAPTGKTEMLDKKQGVPDPDGEAAPDDETKTKLTPLEQKAVELDAMKEPALRELFGELKGRNAKKNAKEGTIRDAIFQHYRDHGLK